jgi:hypothetical protein
MHIVISYIIYLVISINLTIWVARTENHGSSTALAP